MVKGISGTNGRSQENVLVSSVSLRVSALLSAPRCDTTQLLFIPIRLAPIFINAFNYVETSQRLAVHSLLAIRYL